MVLRAFLCFDRRAESSFIHPLYRRNSPTCGGVRQLYRKQSPAEGLARRLRRRSAGATLWGTVLLWQANRRGAGGERKAPLQAALHNSSAGSSFLSRGLTRRLRRGSGTCRPTGRSHFSFDGERKVCKRKPAARRLQRRPTSLCTAAKPCAALGLGYALHGFQPFLALVGLRPPLAVGFGLR